MVTNGEIRKMLREFIGSVSVDATIVAKVKSVDRDKCTCTVEDNDVEYFGVRLRPITGNNTGIVMFPKIDSNIMLVKVEDTEEWAMISATQYDCIQIEIESLIINGGENGGLTNTPELVRELNKNNEILQTILQVISAPVNEPGNSNPSAFQAALNLALAGKEVGDFSRIEDTKIKH